MRVFVVFILFFLLGQQTAVNGQQTSCTSDAYSRTVDSCPLSVDYYELQIRKADSLYKNYLPQTNFDEVKAAVEFFDSIRNYGKRKTIPNSTFLISNYQCARAHYYHAVGLTERDDIVGACEHYLIALEIMDEMMASDKSLKAKGKKSVDSCPLSVDNPEDYEKIRFGALICNRLGRLFYNENYCDLAIIKYRKAISYVDLINDSIFKANLLKELANTYQLTDDFDSALCYYNESLKNRSDLLNRLDVDKSVAKILYDKGKKDTAYSLIKNNLNVICNENLRYSYCATLGKMYFEDKIYDSAICFYETSVRCSIINIKLTSAINLSAIYDSIGNKQKKAVYDEILSKLLVEESKDIVVKNKLQSIYERYKERKLEREKIINGRKIFSIIISLSCIVILMFTVIILIRSRYNKKHLELSRILNEKERNIIDKDDIINQITEEIKLKEDELQKLLFKNSFTDGKLKSKNAEIQNKDELIRKYELEIISLNNKLERTKSGLTILNEYYNSEVCSRILKQIEDLSEKNIDISRLEPLKQEDFFLLLKYANRYLNNLINDLSNRFPKLKKEDLYYLCLIIINLNDKQISSLFGVTYNSIKVRKRKICSIFNITTEELYGFINNYI